jgi:nucleoside-diphosphate-sugar epimerase
MNGTPRRILVTGCSGYIGARLTAALASRGYAVTGLDRRPPADPRGFERFVLADLLDAQHIREALRGVDAVFHLAAARGDFGIPSEGYQRDNVEATRALLEAGRKAGVRSWVFFSTVSAMGPSAASVDEAAPLNPETDYGVSKAEAEALFRALADEDPAACILVLRPSVVYGPGNFPDTNVYRMIRAIDRGRFVMVGDGQTRKTLSYIDNVLAATLFCWDRVRPGLQTFIYVDEPLLSTAQIVATVCRALGRSIPRWRIPLGPAVALAAVMDGLAKATGIDFPITAARIRKFCTDTVFDAGAIRGLGFRQPVDNERALAATVHWYRATVSR